MSPTKKRPTRIAVRNASPVPWLIRSEVDITLELDALATRLRAALAKSPKPETELSLSFVSHAKSKELNTAFRKKREVANVLSFPLRGVPKEEQSAGDVFIAYPILRKGFPSSMSDEDIAVALAIHGMLHLMGFNHRDDASAERMERLEDSIYS